MRRRAADPAFRGGQHDGRNAAPDIGRERKACEALRGEALSGAITWEQILFFIGLLGAISGVWWRVEGKVKEAKTEAVQKASEAAAEAAKVRADLAAHRLHCAETYITKAGMRESTELIMEALQGVKQAVDHMALRVDRVVENQASKPRAARGV